MSNQNKIDIAVDAVIFGYCKNNGISILLIKRKYEPFKNEWALPGGFVLKNESLEEAIYRELREETGINIQYMEQLYTFGEVNRDPRGRVISVSYFGLVKTSDFLKLNATTDAKDAQWHNIKSFPDLAFDHKEIIETAIQRLKSKIRYEPIGFELLDEKFPFSDLEKLYETLLEREIDRRNFKKKIMSFGIIEELKEKEINSKPGRRGYLYKFNSSKYAELKNKGMSFDI